MTGEGKQELLILNRTQFGYHLDTYYYCKFVAKTLKVTYIGFDSGNERLYLEGVEVKYMAYGGCRLRRYLRLLTTFAGEAKRCQGAVFVLYFPGCSLLRWLAPRARMIVDIRTGSVSQNPGVRRWEDRLMRWECRVFRHVSAISNGLVERLHLDFDQTHILPLGAERVDVTSRRFDRLDLLYVGTLYGRRIEDTVVGFERFRKAYGAVIALTYTIVGDGPNGQLEELRRIVYAKGLTDVVYLPGYVHTTRLQETFARCNVGVSYVPISDIYDCQPATKTFEYIFAGMPVIATATKENQKSVNRLNGTLIQDTPDGFYEGLKEIYRRRGQFDSDTIRRSCLENSWDRIVHRDFIPYIRSVCQS